MDKKLLTRRGVCKNLEFSPYVYTYFHEGKVVSFNFSSKLHLDKFTNLRKKNYSMIYNDINKRFKFKIDCTYLADFNLYKKIENRGCFIRFGGDMIKDLDEVSILK